MSDRDVKRLTESKHRALCARLRRAGLVLLRCAPDGSLERVAELERDWLVRLAAAAPVVQRALRQVVTAWNGCEQPELVELLSGWWAAPIPLVERRKRVGYAVLLVPSDELLKSEFLAACCQASRQDLSTVRRLLERLPTARACEVPRLVMLARTLYEDDAQLDDSIDTVEKVSQQLAESYEEISLLYALSQNMNVVQRPGRFITTACDGLLATLCYDWIGVHFHSTEGMVRQLAGKFIMVGEARESAYRTQRLTRQLLDELEPHGPMVIDPDQNSRFANLRPLGRPVLVHPITRDDRVLGALIVAGKRGEDREASSVDMKLIGAAASHIGIFLENAALYEDMNAMFLGTLEALTASIDAKDRYTCGHSLRVAHLSQLLAKGIGLDEDEINRVRIAGLVHDVGKIGVPESVLSKPGHLTDEEFGQIKRHPEIGHRILKDIPQLRDILPGVLHHHERWDGTGYPHGVGGEEIPLYARIIALADSFDAMSSTRTYREARDRTMVLSEIRRCAGTQFDPTLAPIFLSQDFSEYDRMVAEHRAADVRPGQSRGNAA